MPIISYAQNFEDVILWRALKHVERGFYIDVGAQDPVIDSVSLAFYEQGWRGVHVEPTKFYANKLREARPDETVIQAAIGARRGRITFWEFPGTGLSTGDPAIAKMHRQQNRKCAKITTSCMRLSQLLERYRGKEIHWLKIDVEGMEKSVIQSWQPSKARPWIVVVESTKPMSTEVSFADFDPLAVKLGYDFVYFDGVNRFYVSREHPELKNTFGPGPNFFDHAVLAGSTPFGRKIASEAADLRNKLSARAIEVAQLAQSFEAERATLRDEFAKSASAWEQASTAFAAELATKRAETAKCEDHIHRLESDVAELNELMASKEQTSAALAAELAAKNAALTAELFAKNTEIAKREEKIGRLESEVSGLRELMLSKEQTSAALAAGLAAKNAEIAMREENIGRLESEVSGLRELMLSKEQTSAALAAELAAKNAEIAMREENIGRLESDVTGLNELMASKEQSNMALAAELAAKNAEIAKRDEGIGRLEGDVARLSQHISKLDALREEATVHETNLRLHLAAVYDLHVLAHHRTITTCQPRGATPDALPFAG